MRRRTFLHGSAAATLGIACSPASGAVPGRAPRLLLRSSWQTANIGDIAHTPGMIALLQKRLPEVRVTLWPTSIDNGVGRLLREKFPALEIIDPTGSDLRRAFRDCDFLLHGSGASIVARRDLERWRNETGKPYGVYGVTLARQNSWETEPRSAASLARDVEVLDRARFVYFRDTPSLALARELGASCPVMRFGPDAAFACDLRDDPLADAFLVTHGLEAGRFLCCIPRLRYTPYWKIDPDTPFDPKRHTRNEQMKEQDHEPLREAVVRLVEQTDMKVLVCPEDRTQMAVGKELIVDRLPKPVLERVVWRPDYWLTGEATSVYRRSAGLFGAEMHSPILCVGQGVPAVVCRFHEQTTKGLMWRDIGLGDWLFDLDSSKDRRRVAPTVLDIAERPTAARERVAAAKDLVDSRQDAAMQTLREELSLP